MESAVAACGAAIGPGIIIAFFRNRILVDVDDASLLKNRRSTGVSCLKGLLIKHKEISHMSADKSLSSILSNLAVVESDWKFVTSAGAELSVNTPIAKVGVNLTGGLIRVKRDSDPQPTQLNFGGVGGSVGLGLVPLPAKFSFSLPQMPSVGRIYKLPWARQTLDLNEMKGAMVMFQIGADAGPGVSGAFMFLGGRLWFAAGLGGATMGAGHLPGLVMSSNACVKFGGMTANVIPVNVGVTAYVGGIG
jgi:hypothetical protein